MKLYHLYVSGILYAELDFDTQPISIQKLDIASGKLLPWETLSEEVHKLIKLISFLLVPGKGED